VSSITDYQSFNGISVNYSQRRIKEKELFIPYSSWLVADLEKFQNIPIKGHGETFQLFPNEPNNDFDLFAAIFYAIARVEEYLPFKEDAHERFPAHSSVFFKYKILEIPIVDHWVIRFLKSLELLFKAEINIDKIKPSWSIGIDIDQFYKYRKKNLIKTCGGLMKSLFKLNLKEVANRFQIILLKKKDPYDSYDEIKSLHPDPSQFIFFILCGGHSVYDKNHSLKLQIIQSILNELKQFARIGLHPSYSSNNKISNIELEKKALENVVNFEIILSRQHYLKLRFPNTYRQLTSLGIHSDFSLGYADFPGFRAGTSRIYNWYDLEMEKETELLLTPLIAMDRSYLSYLKYTPEQCVIAIQNLFDICRNVGGHFHLVWHNSSFDFEGEWKNWDNVLKTLVDYFRQHEN
jgi:hypothetical protein